MRLTVLTGCLNFKVVGDDMKRLLVVVLAAIFLGGCKQNALQTTANADGVWYNDNAERFAVAETEPVKRIVKISAAGDVTLATDVNYGGGGSFVNEVKNQGYDYSYFFRNVSEIFENDDLTIVNFEGTLSENGARKDKTYAFRGNPEYAEILVYGSVEAVNTANNHSYDYGEISYKDTIEHIENAGITTFGYDRTAVYEANGVKVGLFGISALSATSVSEAKAKIDDAVAKLEKDGAELIIFNVHWGIERDNIPNDKQRQIGEYAIDCGADLVLGHHPHVIQSVQKYNDRYIVYSLGNFCFGGNKNPSDKDCIIWQQEFELDENGLTAVCEPDIIPCSVSSVTSRNNYQPTPLEGERGQRVLNRIKEYSENLGMGN